ncbi:Type IV pilus biogenesis factor PilY1 [Polaromonas vacuolata]|uniref:Type IV pilus biogenesis factor PilY1 n=1 Tax=Polaromonas vacuolata TaxID=37448 RepID=A0A6H2H985_9BURK|nr:PilC/PilY family type IV pilus protein [Polaromonas vacuolata]QJC56441.1 Type IV pilus biogenesis factor PilY1 [Polaromonas vacuolata]
MNKNLFKPHPFNLVLCLFLICAGDVKLALAATTDIANTPMATTTMVTPNVLVIYDNSQSMDAFMNGVMVSGNNPNTRGNIGRAVMRNAFLTYRNAFNWGLMTYAVTSNNGPYSTYAYYLGSTLGMVFTSNCTGYSAGVFNGVPAQAGTSTSGGGKCIANPQPSTGREFVTFNLSSDDSNIVDVLYYGSYSGLPTYAQLWAPAINSSNPTTYSWYENHTSNVSTWNVPADFNNPIFSSTLTPTDAGFVPSNSGASSPNNISRSLYLPRGWGYLANVSGGGTLNEAVMTDSTTHFNKLQSLLGNETSSATGEIKNSAIFTTLKGTLNSAKTYFSSGLGSPNFSPITQSCQQNFVMLVTDGLPTGNASGALYSESDRTNTCLWSKVTNSCTGGVLGVAANDAIQSVQDLRTLIAGSLSSTRKDGTGLVTGKFDVQTYVVALGDTLANPNALSVMDAMAYGGGTDASIAASDSATFQAAITSVTEDIIAKVGAASAVAVANAHVTSTDNASYASSYNSGTWSGDVNAYSIDLTTGLPSTVSLWSAGSAATQLDLRQASSRYIVSSPDAAGAIGGIQFQPSNALSTTKLSASQQTLLNTTASIDGAAVLAYLRGDRSGETALTYRARAHLLGDIINAEPLLVREPSASYSDTGYTSFKQTNSARSRVLYQAANDGMLHAFAAASGAELWAFVPNLVLSSLNNLSRSSGFSHQYTVDGTPVSGDVDFNNVGGNNNTVDWRTILVGGLAKGGRGYYALDVTNANAASEAAVSGKVLWEFPNSVSNAGIRSTAKLNMGYSFGRPVIVKTLAKGWVVLVSSGYNNGTNSGESGGDGLGHLYVLNPKTGDLIADIPTTGCTTSPNINPCGLSELSAYVSNGDIDNTTDYVYGGDLKGNLWRFDLSGNTVNQWQVAKFATLKDGNAVAQPITTAPELTLTSDGRMVYVGTGQYLGSTDIAGSIGANSNASQTQTIYGLKDSFVALTDPVRSVLQQQTFTTSGNNRVSSNNSVDYAVKKGWFIDLPSSGERINTNPALAGKTLVFSSNIPNLTVCQPGGSSWAYFLNIRTGGLVENSTLSWSGVFLGNALASRPVLIQLPSGKIVSLVRTSDAQTIKQDVPVSSIAFIPKRTSWRELFN